MRRQGRPLRVTVCAKPTFRRVTREVARLGRGVTLGRWFLSCFRCARGSIPHEVSVVSLSFSRMQPLPIDPLLPEIVGALRAHTALVLEAPPGAGKTTRVPRALLDAGFATSGEIVVLEPRRLAARLAARRVADELGENIGATVGYQVRFENVSSARTRVRFVTEGVLSDGSSSHRPTSIASPSSSSTSSTSGICRATSPLPCSSAFARESGRTYASL